MAFGPDRSRIVSAGRDGTVKVKDAASGQEAFSLKGHTGPALSVPFSPDGKRIASADGDQVKIWDAASGQEALSLKAHRLVRSVAFSPDGKRIAAVGEDGPVKVWDGTQILCKPMIWGATPCDWLRPLR